MIGTMTSFFIVALLCLVGWSNSQRCPAKYLRFTPQHSFCLSPNPSCRVLHTGVSQQDKQLILRLHNQFRSKVAMGQEDRTKDGNRMPQAADMMQMEWDDELAAVAQKWTENCVWGHDCDDCKAVENFPVGQNLVETGDDADDKPDWTSSITGLYNEVFDYYTNWLGSFVSHPGPKTGHLTQLVWSESWRVGCGFSYFNRRGTFYKYYACNYGPGGNVEYQPVYKQGQPCSACPTNTQCSSFSRGANSFPGLCKMDNPNTAPVYPLNKQGLLFYCDFSSTGGDCQSDVSGDGSWRTVRSVGGNYNSVVLQGGQSTKLSFRNPITPHVRPFCIKLNYRKGPLDASRGDQSTFQANYKMQGGFAPPMTFNPKSTSFGGVDITLPWGKKTTFSFTFSVSRGAGQHVLDIRKIAAYDGECP